MPFCISIRFLTGRAHLHHWHAHHSDGKVDWPPSPWRLLRAIVSAAGAGMTSLPQPLDESISATPEDSLPVSHLVKLLALLAAPPGIWLPRTSGGHTRQFLPMKFKASGSAVFDSFAAVSKDTPIVFEWPDVQITENDEQFTDLQMLLRRLTYFGRAESWCEATAHLGLPPRVLAGVSHWCCSGIDNDQKPIGREHVDFTIERTLAPELPLETALKQQVVELLPRCFFPEERRKNDRRSAEFLRLENRLRQVLSRESTGQLLLRCLLRSSGEDIKDGLQRPIGSRWLRYSVPRAIYRVPDFRSQRVAEVAKPPVTLFRFALNTATVNRAVLPPLTDTLLFADKFRAAALAWHAHLKSDEHPRNLCGREADDSRVNGHDHAFFWPTDEDNDGFIDHVSVFCPSGFLPGEVEALRRLLRIGQRSRRPDLLVTPLFLGQAESFAPWRQTARLFVSATPYFCPVHLGHGKKSGGVTRSLAVECRRSLTLASVIRSAEEVSSILEIVFAGEADLANVANASTLTELRQSGLGGGQFVGALLKAPDADLLPGMVRGLKVDRGNRFIPALAFCRRRRRHQINGFGRFLVIEFAAPRLARPFSIASQCHFGLGLFVPATVGEP